MFLGVWVSAGNLVHYHCPSNHQLEFFLCWSSRKKGFPPLFFLYVHPPHHQPRHHRTRENLLGLTHTHTLVDQCSLYGQVGYFQNSTDGVVFARKTWCHCLHRIGFFMHIRLQLNGHAQFDGTFSWHCSFFFEVENVVKNLYNKVQTAFNAKRTEQPRMWLLRTHPPQCAFLLYNFAD